jgi:protein arginine N-methyltransferase 5
MLSWFPLFFPFRVRVLWSTKLYKANGFYQEPLYLPSGSELQVSIWRLTNERQVWYEWHAESFLMIMTPPGGKDELSMYSSGKHNLPSPTSVPSPLADDDTFFRIPASSQKPSKRGASLLGGGEYDVVKIGHTSLHNPGGRSSWIGL